MMKQPSRSELIELVEKLLSNEGTEQQDAEWRYIIRCNVPDPDVGDLYGTELSAEEIIDRALAYQPVLLGPSSLDPSTGRLLCAVARSRAGGGQ